MKLAKNQFLIIFKGFKPFLKTIIYSMALKFKRNTNISIIIKLTSKGFHMFNEVNTMLINLYVKFEKKNIVAKIRNIFNDVAEIYA